MYAMLSFAVGLSAWAFWMARLGPVAVSVDGDGLRFRMDSGSIDSLPWGKVTHGVAMIDYSDSPLTRYSRRLWEIRRWNRPPTDLTKDAFEAIVAEAAARGFALRSSTPQNSRWGPCRVIRFETRAREG